MLQPKTIAVLGAGTRGALFGRILDEMPHLARVVAVAEPREAYRADFARRHDLPPEAVFTTWQEFVAAPRRCDAVVIATMDRDHLGPTLACLALGYDVLLEKPMAATLEDCLAIEQAQRQSGAIMAICHSLRYQKGFHRVKELLDAGRIGRVVTIDQIEQVGFHHFAHSYIRGNWGNAGRATPMLLAKSCHDLDYMTWLVGADCLRVSSFGTLSHFRPESGPAGAPSRCTDGCPYEAGCTYSAIKQYVQADLHTWPASVCSPVHTREAHLEAIRTGPYGRCVYRADNDVVDHQVVMLEFENDVTATFTMTGFTHGMGRRLRVHGTEGELAFDEETITIKTFADRNVETIAIAPEPGEHGGGDVRVFRNWLEALHRRDPELILATAQESLRTHAIAFAAEQARHERRVVEMGEFLSEWTGARVLSPGS